MMSAKEELNCMCNLKIIMTVLVVLYHSILALSSSGWAGQEFSYTGIVAPFLATWLNTMHIYVFTFVSGYLFYMLRYEMGKYRTPRRDIVGRIRRLLIPYVFATILWVAPAQMIFKDGTVGELIKNYVFAIAPGQLWFLPMLFLIYIIFYLFGDLFDKLELHQSLCLLSILYLMQLLLKQIIPLGVFQISTALEYSLFYYMGFFYRKKGEHILEKISLVLIMGCNIFLVGVYYYLSIKNVNWLVLGIIKPIVCGSSIYFAIKIGIFIKIGSMKNKWITLLGDNSMGIYLLHQQIIYMYTRLISRDIISGCLYVLFCCMISLGLSITASLLLKNTKIGSLMLGT